MGKDVERLQISVDLETGDFASKIKQINSSLNSLEKQFKQLDKGLDGDSFQHYALQIDKCKQSMKLMEKELELQGKQHKSLGKILDQQKAKLKELAEAGQQGTKDYKNLEKNIGKNTAVYNNLGNAIENNKHKMAGWANEILQANEAIQKLENNAQTLEQKLSKISSNEALKTSEWNKMSSELEGTGRLFKQIGNEIKALDSQKGFNTQKIEAYRQEVEKLESSNKDLTSSKDELINKIKKEEQALEKARQKQLALKKAVENAEKNNNTESIKKYSKNYEKASQDVQQLEMSLASLKDELRGVDTAFDSNSDSLNEYRANINDLEAENNRLNRTLASIGYDTVGNKLKSVGSTLKNVGRELTQNVTTPVVASGIAVAKMTMDYQKSLNKVGTITGLAGKELQKYGEEAIEISNKTGVAVTDINEAIYQAVSGGVEVGKATQFVADATKLSIGGFAETADTIDLLTTLYNVYGDTIGDVTKVSDKLIATQNLGKTSVGELSQQMGEVVSVAGTYGVSMDNILASYAKLTAGGLNTAKSTTSIQRMLEELGDSGSDVAEILQQKTGKSFKGLMEEGHNLGDVLGILKQYADDAGIELNELFSSSEAGQGALGLVAENGKSFNEFLQGIAESSGMAQEAFDKMSSDAGTKFMNSINELKNSLLDFGIAMTPMIESITDFVKKITDALNNMSDESKESILKVIGAIALLGPVLSGLGNLFSVINGVTTTIGSLKGALTTLSASSGALGGVASAIGGISAGAVGLTAVAGAFLAIATAVGDSAKALSYFQDEFGAVGDFIANYCERLNGLMQLTFGGIFEGFKGLGKVWGAVLKGDFDEIDDIITETYNNIKTSQYEALSDLSGDTSKALKSMKNMTKQELSGVKNVFDTTFKDLPNMTSESMDKVANELVSKTKDMSQQEIEIMKGMGGEIGATLFNGINEGMDSDEMAEQFKSNLNRALQAGLLTEGEVNKYWNEFNSMYEKGASDSIESIKKNGTELFNTLKESNKKGWEEAIKESSNLVDDWNQEMIDKQKSFGEGWGALLEDVNEGMSDDEVYKTMLSNFEDYCKERGIKGEEFLDQLRKEQQEAHKILNEGSEVETETTDPQSSFEALDMDVKVKLKTEFEGVDEGQLYNIHTILNQFPEEIQTKIKGEGFKEVLAESKSVEEFITKLPDDKLVNLVTNSEFRGALTPEQLQLAIDELPNEEIVHILTKTDISGYTPEEISMMLLSLPRETRADVITECINTGKMTPEQLGEALKTVPPQTIAQVLMQYKESGKYTPEQLNRILLSLPTETRALVEAVLNGEEKVENLNNDLESVPEETNTTVNVNAEGATEAKQEIESIPEKKDVEVEAKQKGNFFDTIKGWFNKSSVETVEIEGKVTDVEVPTTTDATINVKGKVTDIEMPQNTNSTIEVKASVTGSNQITTLKNNVTSLQGKTVTITASVKGNDQVNTLKNNINSLKGKSVTVTASVKGTNETKALKSAIDTVKQKSVTVKATVSGTNEVKALKNAIDGLKSKSVSVKASVSGTSEVRALASAIASVQSKTATVKVNKTVTTTQKTVQEKSTPRSNVSTTSNTPSTVNTTNLSNIPISASDTPTSTNTSLANIGVSAKASTRSSVLESVKYGVEPYKELEQALDKIASQFDIIDKKAEQAFGLDKVGLLNKQIDLMKQQQKLQHGIADEEREQLNVLKSQLQSKGFLINADNEILNYEEKLLALEKNVEALREKSDNSKDDEGLKKQYENANEELGLTKKYLSEFIESNKQLSNASVEWWELSNTIKETHQSILDILNENLEREIDKIADSIDFLSERIDNLNGQEKIKYIEQQNILYRQQQQVLHQLAEQLRSQLKLLDISSEAYAELSSKISDLSTEWWKLESSINNNQMEIFEEQTRGTRNEVDSLADSIDFLDKKIDNLNGQEKIKYIEQQNDLYKQQQNTLHKLAEQMRSQLKSLNPLSEEYADLSSEISNCSTEWWELQNSIQDNQMKIFEEQTKIARNEIDNLTNSIDFLDAKMDNYSGEEKIALIKEQNELYKQQQDALHVLAEQLRGQLSSLAPLSEEYQDMKNEISDLSTEWWKLEEAINDNLESIEEINEEFKDSLRSQLETTKKVEEKITEIYEKEYENRQKAIEEQYNKQSELLKKQLEQYKEIREQQNYEKGLQGQTTEIEELRKKLEIAKRDTSLQGLKRQKEIAEELAEAEKELQEMTQDKIDKDFEKNINNEIDKLESTEESLLNALEEQFNEVNIAKMVANAMTSGFVEVNGEIESLQNVLLDSINNSADVYSVMGATIKSEIVDNLNTALDTMKNLESIYNNLDLSAYAVDLSKVDYSGSRYTPTASTSNTVNNQNIDFNPVININVEGNNGEVDVEAIKSEVQDVLNQTLKQMASGL